MGFLSKYVKKDLELAIERDIREEFYPELEVTVALENGEKKEKPKIKIKNPGAMTAYCKDHGFDGVTCECLCMAMREDDPVWHKRAVFAYNFGWRRNKRTCECMEEIIQHKKEK